MQQHHSNLRRTIGSVATLASVLALIAAFASPATAAGPVPVECDTGGVLSVTPGDGGGATWSVHLEGMCSGQLSGTSIVSVDGSGTSNGAGLCDGSIVVQNLALNLIVSERNVVTGDIVTTNQTWSAPVATYPLATAFSIGGEARGAGAMLSRIFLRCGATGSANTRAAFSFRS